MKIVCSKAELSRVISLASSAASTKNMLPVLTNLLFEADQDGLVVTGTDLELGLRVKVKVEVVEPGAATLPAKKLAEIVRSFDDGDVEITVKEGTKGEIKSGRAKINLVGVPAEDFPNFPGYQREKSLTLPSKTLIEMIKRTSFSVSQDETRYILQGGLLNASGSKARMVTTDGHRLSYMEVDAQTPAESVSAVIPSKALNELGRILPGDDTPVTLYFTDNQVFAEAGDLTLFSRLLDGQFPNYDQVIPKKNDQILLAEQGPLQSVVTRMSLLAGDKGNSVKFHMKDDSLQVTAATADLGEGSETLDVEYRGQSMTVAFNARYLLDVFKALGAERVELRMSTPLSPTLITPAGGNGNCKYVVMPMRA